MCAGKQEQCILIVLEVSDTWPKPTGPKHPRIQGGHATCPLSLYISYFGAQLVKGCLVSCDIIACVCKDDN